jgi:hypothetical protein
VDSEVSQEAHKRQFRQVARVAEVAPGINLLDCEWPILQHSRGGVEGMKYSRRELLPEVMMTKVMEGFGKTKKKKLCILH